MEKKYITWSVGPHVVQCMVNKGWTMTALKERYSVQDNQVIQVGWIIMQSGTKCSLCRLKKKLLPKKRRPPSPTSNLLFNCSVPLQFFKPDIYSIVTDPTHKKTFYGSWMHEKSHVDAILHLRVGAMVSSFSCNLWQMLKFRAQHHSFN